MTTRNAPRIAALLTVLFATLTAVSGSVFATVLTASSAMAQDVIDSALSDLNGDGLRERFTLLRYPGAGTVDLIVEDTGTGRITARDIAWIGGIGQEPELDVAPNGSIRLVSMNEAVGRNRWHQTLTIAHRDGAYRIAGFAYAWYDTLDLDAAGECDLNLLNGKGFLTIGQGPKQTIAHFEPAVELTAWKDDRPIPEICRAWD